MLSMKSVIKLKAEKQVNYIDPGLRVWMVFAAVFL